MQKTNKGIDLTPKQRAMIKERLSDKTAPNSTIIRRAGYQAKTNQTASQIYLENMKKPEIAKQLNDVVDEMEDTLITVVRENRDSDKLGEKALATDTAKWIHDKVKGKATQRVEQHSTTVNLNLDLTQITDS